MASCPSCGVAIVPGYVKCPKCGNPLPALARTKSNTFGSGGGTAVTDGGGSRLPLIVALGAGAAIVIVMVVVLGGGGGSKTASATATPAADETDDDDDDPTATQPAQPDDPVASPAPPAIDGADALAAAAELDRELKRQRLWGTVKVIDDRVDVRSSACEDQGMGAVIDAARPRLQGAGLTKMRCLAQSGAVVFERDF
ncbi:MAG: hypothetical protein ACKV2T_01270 [Kofleriaceae bacterium]